MAGPLIFTVPAYGFVMALYLDCLGRAPTRERFPLTCVERQRINEGRKGSQGGHDGHGAAEADRMFVPCRRRVPEKEYSFSEGESMSDEEEHQFRCGESFGRASCEFGLPTVLCESSSLTISCPNQS